MEELMAISLAYESRHAGVGGAGERTCVCVCVCVCVCAADGLKHVDF